MQELQLLSEKLDILVKKYSALQAENKRLKETVAQQLQNIETLNGKLATVEENMSALQIGKTMLSQKEKEVVRRQVDNVIGEIDKILTSLDE